MSQYCECCGLTKFNLESDPDDLVNGADETALVCLKCIKLPLNERKRHGLQTAQESRDFYHKWFGK